MALENLRKLGVWRKKKTIVSELDDYEDTSSLKKIFFFSWVMLGEAGLQGIKKGLDDKEVEVVGINYFTKSLVMERQMLMSYGKWIDCSYIWGIADVNYFMMTLHVDACNWMDLYSMS